MAQLLLEDYVSKRNKIINNPQFAQFWSRYTAGAFGGVTFDKNQFVNNIAAKFDPTAKSISIIQEPQQDGTMKEVIRGDAKYLDFIFTNLFNGNISLGDAQEVYDTLEAYRVQTARNNPQVSKELQSYKVFFEDPNVKDRNGNVLPGLIKALKPYTTPYDFENNRFPNLATTEAFMQENNIDQVFATAEHKFYLLKDQEQSKIVLGKKSAPDFETSGRSLRCSGYWCLPSLGATTAANYFPCWVAMDKYGFLDYAIVPKQSGTGGEIKNRFNHGDTCITMNDEDYESILEFMITYDGDHADMLIKAFKNFLTTTSKSLNVYGLSGDFGQFILRSKNYRIVNKLTNSTAFSTDIDVVLRASAAPTTQMLSKQVYEDFINDAHKGVVDYVKKLAPPTRFPMLAPLYVDSIQEVQNGPYSYENYAASFIPAMLSAFKQAFPHDTDLLEDNAKGCKVLINFITSSLPTIKQINPALGNRIDAQIANLLEQDRLYFEAKTELSMLTFVADQINEAKLLNKTQVLETNAYKALRESFELYLSLGGLLNWTDSQGTALNQLSGLRRLISMAQGASDNTKKKFFITLMQGGSGATAQRRATTLKQNTLRDLIAYATELNIPINDGIGRVFRMLDNILNSANDDRMAAAVEAVAYLKGFDDIVDALTKNARYIKTHAPLAAQILGAALPKTVFSKFFPNASKFAITRRAVASAKRGQAFNELSRASQDGYIMRANDEDARLAPSPFVVQSVSQTFKVAATKENLQNIVDICDRSYSHEKYYNFIGSFALLLNNENFKPQHIFVGFGNRPVYNLRQMILSREVVNITPSFAIVGTVGDRKISINSQGSIWFTPPGRNTVKSVASYSEYEDEMRGAMFEKFTMKKAPKNSFAFLVEKLRV